MPTAVQLAPLLSGRVVVSMANAMTRVGAEFQALLPVRGSIAATIQAAVPEARVTAAFHHLPAGRLGQLDRPIEADVLVCADDDEAGDQTVRLVESIPDCVGCGPAPSPRPAPWNRSPPSSST